MPNHVVILKTGRLHEFELACNALKESGIPHHRQEESSAGLRTAMYTPAMGPGSFWNLLVPVSEKARAEKILSELPTDFTTNPDIWHFGAKPKQKKVWRTYSIFILLITGFVLLYKLYELIAKNNG